MLPQNNPERSHIVFDDRRLVANAGLLFPATPAQHLSLRELVDPHLKLGGAPARASTEDQMLTQVASVLADGERIDATDAMRADATVGVLRCVAKAPSTPGTFLRSFRWSHGLPGRPLLMAVCGVESNIGNLRAGPANSRCFRRLLYQRPARGSIQRRAGHAPSQRAIGWNRPVLPWPIQQWDDQHQWRNDPVQNRPAHGGVLVNGLSHANGLDLVVPQSAQQIQHLGHRPARAVQRPTQHSRPAVRQPSNYSAQPVPGCPAAYTIEDRSRPGCGVGLEVVGVGVAGHQHAGESVGLPDHLSLTPVLAWRRDATASGV